MKPQAQTQTTAAHSLATLCRNPQFIGNLYVLVVITFVCFLYITTVLLAWIVKMPLEVGKVFFLLFVHASFFMFLWSFCKTILTDPGRVPLHWGFYLDDPEHKKRRYCLVCHIFKPERCHHCSVCNRCVLNMDHHCPWINNCVGFYNRKFFILMLFYVVLTTFIILCGEIKILYVIVEETLDYFEKGETEIQWALNFFIIFGAAADFIMFFVIICFLKFHCTLIYSNMTTIEHLDSKRGTSIVSTTNFDIGFWYNFYQIFGKNWVLWPFPMFLESGKPVGDGVVWLQRHKDSDINDNMDGSEMGSIKKIIVDDMKRELIKEERLKKSNILPSNNQDFSNFPPSDNKKYYPDENRNNNNVLGFSENANKQNNFLQNSPSLHANQTTLDMNPPKRMFVPVDNMILDERNNHKIYTEYRPTESPYQNKKFKMGGEDYNRNISNPYGLTGYSQPNSMNYKEYEARNENKNDVSALKSKSTYGYNRFDIGH